MHIVTMTTAFQNWMASRALNDREVSDELKAKGVDLSRSQVSRIRRNGTDSLSTAAKLADLTGLPVESFALRGGDPDVMRGARAN